MNTELRDRLLRLNVDLAATRLSTEDAIRLACDLLVAEVDTPAVVELAGASVRSTYTPDAALLVEQMLAELGIEQMSQRQASWWFARDVARLMVSGELNREDGETVLWSFGLELDNVALSPGALSLEEIISTADSELTRWTT